MATVLAGALDFAKALLHATAALSTALAPAAPWF